MLFLFIVFCGVVTACGSSDQAANSGGHSGHNENEGFEVTSSADVMPSFLKTYTPRTGQLYARVNEYEELLKTLNCYCGCMDYAENRHDSLYRCFIMGKENGRVTWTDHGTQCGVCLNELKDATDMASKGKSNEEIRKAIDAAYKGSI
ncbi:hypothetical protein SY83_20540 [Paenibacillus swuensis]|uniref:Uncharacterized protein n=2 Tax=Paenibacillus swuensis TaxID=1178515 RepID=A0A172TQ93_9BACL|nr:hypothetical protein SY83_20540 [Paenibacillus swuensis]